MQRGLLQQLFAQKIGQWLQHKADGADPLGQHAAGEVDPQAQALRLLPVQRQVVGVLGNHRLRQQRRCGLAAIDDQLFRHNRTQRLDAGNGGKLLGRHAAIVMTQNVCAGTSIVDNRIHSRAAQTS
jgi:hypothetical protein